MKLLLEQWAGAGIDLVNKMGLFKTTSLKPDEPVTYSDCCQLWASVQTGQPLSVHGIKGFVKSRSVELKLERAWQESDSSFGFINIPLVKPFLFLDKGHNFSNKVHGVPAINFSITPLSFWVYPPKLRGELKKAGINYSRYSISREKPDEKAGYDPKWVWTTSQPLTRLIDCIRHNNVEREKAALWLAKEYDLDYLFIRWMIVDTFSHIFWRRRDLVEDAYRCCFLSHKRLLEELKPEKHAVISGFGFKDIPKIDTWLGPEFGDHDNTKGFYKASWFDAGPLAYAQFGKKVKEVLDEERAIR